MEFGQQMIDILVYVSCKFEMYIFKIAQFISENVCIAFLYVLSILLLLFILCFLYIVYHPFYCTHILTYSNSHQLSFTDLLLNIFRSSYFQPIL